VAQQAFSVFSKYEAVVCPSSSCTAMLRDYERLGLCDERPGFECYELCEFLIKFFPEANAGLRFEYQVAVHQSCHGLRELRLGKMSERVFDRTPSVLEATLAGVSGIRLVTPERQDECCGFGGSFSIDEADVSARMGQDKLSALEAAGAEVVTSSDMSCLMHLEGIARRRNSPIRLLHISQILAGRVEGLPEQKRGA
jgi:L-lactate dehydrogenase complex protein LldE